MHHGQWWFSAYGLKAWKRAMSPMLSCGAWLTLPFLRVMEVVVTMGAVRHAKLQSNCHDQQTNTQVFTGWMPFLSPNQQCDSTEGKRRASGLQKILSRQSLKVLLWRPVDNPAWLVVICG